MQLCKNIFRRMKSCDKDEIEEEIKVRKKFSFTETTGFLEK